MEDSKQAASVVHQAESKKLPEKKMSNGKNSDVQFNNSVHDDEISKLDQIRDMLFGEHVATLKNEYKVLDNNLNKNVSELRKELNNSIDVLKEQIDKKFDQLHKMLQAEQADRQLNNEELSNNLVNVNSDILTKIDLETKRMDEALGAQLQESTRQLNTMAESLQVSKVDRKSLAALFNQFARELEDS